MRDSEVLRDLLFRKYNLKMQRAATDEDITERMKSLDSRDRQLTRMLEETEMALQEEMLRLREISQAEAAQRYATSQANDTALQQMIDHGQQIDQMGAAGQLRHHAPEMVMQCHLR